MSWFRLRVNGAQGGQGIISSNSRMAFKRIPSPVPEPAGAVAPHHDAGLVCATARRPLWVWGLCVEAPEEEEERDGE